MQRPWFRWLGVALCVALLPTLWLACTKHNDKYCLSSADCTADPLLTLCDLLRNECVAPGGPQDLAMMEMKDMITPSPDFPPPLPDGLMPPDLMPQCSVNAD